MDWFGWPRKRFWWWFLRKLFNSRSLSPFKLDLEWAAMKGDAINGTTLGNRILWNNVEILQISIKNFIFHRKKTCFWSSLNSSNRHFYPKKLLDRRIWAFKFLNSLIFFQTFLLYDQFRPKMTIFIWHFNKEWSRIWTRVIGSDQVWSGHVKSSRI